MTSRRRVGARQISRTFSYCGLFSRGKTIRIIFEVTNTLQYLLPNKVGRKIKARQYFLSNIGSLVMTCFHSIFHGQLFTAMAGLFVTFASCRLSVVSWNFFLRVVWVALQICRQAAAVVVVVVALVVTQRCYYSYNYQTRVVGAVVNASYQRYHVEIALTLSCQSLTQPWDGVPMVRARCSWGIHTDRARGVAPLLLVVAAR